MSKVLPIRIHQMVKRYRKQVAVDHLNLEVPAGAVYGLLGENGAGKTTTLRSLLGFVVPDSGTVETLGLDPVAHGIEVRRRVGYVPEQPALYDWMTVAEIGWFAAGFHASTPPGAAGYEAQYKALAREFDLPPKRKIRELSKGGRAKVSLALAMAAEPQLLVLDEPTSGLDVLVRREFLESMVAQAGEGRTVLLSSHQIGEVERVASHVALIHQGKLILAEPLDDLKARTFLVNLTFVGHNHPTVIPASLPIELVDLDDAPRQGRWLVHADSPSVFESLRTLPGVARLEVLTPSLEDIYVGYMRRRGESGPGPRIAAHVA